MKINQNLICLKIDDNYEYEDEEIFNKCRRKFKEKNMLMILKMKQKRIIKKL